MLTPSSKHTLPPALIHLVTSSAASLSVHLSPNCQSDLLTMHMSRHITVALKTSHTPCHHAWEKPTVLQWSCMAKPCWVPTCSGLPFPFPTVATLCSWTSPETWTKLTVGLDPLFCQACPAFWHCERIFIFTKFTLENCKKKLNVLSSQFCVGLHLQLSLASRLDTHESYFLVLGPPSPLCFTWAQISPSPISGFFVRVTLTSFICQAVLPPHPASAFCL